MPGQRPGKDMQGCPTKARHLVQLPLHRIVKVSDGICVMTRGGPQLHSDVALLQIGLSNSGCVQAGIVL